MTQQTPHEIVLSMLREVIDDGDYVIGDAAREWSGCVPSTPLLSLPFSTSAPRSCSPRS